MQTRKKRAQKVNTIEEYRMKDPGRRHKPHKDEQQSGDFGRRNFFVKKNHSGNESQRQTQLTESLNETHIGHMLHGKEDQSIGSGTAYAGDDGVDDLFASELFESPSFSRIEDDQRHFSESQSHLDQKKISQSSGTGETPGAGADQLQRLTVTKGITGGPHGTQRNEKYGKSVQRAERYIAE